jgi:mRNA-degrading endonuclease RelE of RelBE toxin-antitoxin system
VYDITYSEGVADDLVRLPASQRSKILDRIEVQLKHEPTRQTRNKKILVGLVPPWEHMDPSGSCA